MLKVSGNSTTGGACGSTLPRRLNQDLKLCAANGGTSRLVEIPPTCFNTAPSPGTFTTAFANPGATAASRAWNMISPIEYAEAGRRRRL